MFTGPVGPVEVFFYWPKAVLGNFYWPGAIGSPLASSPEVSYFLTLMLLTARLAKTQLCKNLEKPLKPLANGYSSESAQQELSNEYQHDRVLMVLKNLCILALWAKVATALEGLK